MTRAYIDICPHCIGYFDDIDMRMHKCALVRDNWGTIPALVVRMTNLHHTWFLV